MPDGIWSGQEAQEPLQQARILRHRLCTFNLDSDGTLGLYSASSYGCLNPNGFPIHPPPLGPRGAEGGPHFVLSPETADGRPTLGFQWCVFLASGSDLVVDPAGLTVTIWQLIESTMFPTGNTNPRWASFAPVTGVQVNEMYHSFDTNTCALRFQIENPDDEGSNTGAIVVALAEL